MHSEVLLLARVACWTPPPLLALIFPCHISLLLPRGTDQAGVALGPDLGSAVRSHEQHSGGVAALTTAVCQELPSSQLIGG